MLSGLHRRRIPRVRAKEPDVSDRRTDQGAAVGGVVFLVWLVIVPLDFGFSGNSRIRCAIVDPVLEVLRRLRFESHGLGYNPLIEHLALRLAAKPVKCNRRNTGVKHVLGKQVSHRMP
jgi:hypothetical protein